MRTTVRVRARRAYVRFNDTRKEFVIQMDFSFVIVTVRHQFTRLRIHRMLNCFPPSHRHHDVFLSTQSQTITKMEPEPFDGVEAGFMMDGFEDEIRWWHPRQALRNTNCCVERMPSCA
jgi:hypothetical protein